MAQFGFMQAIREASERPEYKGKDFTAIGFRRFTEFVRGHYARCLSPDLSTADLRDIIIERNWLDVDRSRGEAFIRLALPQ